MGDYYFINEPMSVYRLHENNMTRIGNTIKMYFEGALAFNQMISIYPEDKKLLGEQVIRWSLLASEVSISNFKLLKFIKYWFYALIHVRSVLGLKNIIKCTYLLIRRKKIYE
jgi:hypothetical protein